MSGTLGKGRRLVLALVAVAALLGAAAPAAQAAPVLGKAWASSVFATSARLVIELDPNGQTTSYHVNYITKSAYEANVAASKDGFTGALKVPPASDAIAAPGGPPTISQVLFGLKADTAYRWRLVATSSGGQVSTPTLSLATQPLGGGPLLADSRGWEMVSPVQKNGGQADPPESIAGGGVPQAAGGGGAIAYASRSAFGAGAQGAPPASQYLATRTPGGWATQNITAPTVSGAYDPIEGGTPYQLFSADLSRALLQNGDRCAGGPGSCTVPSPPLAGTDAPNGYQDYYLRTSAGGAFEALLGEADLSGSEVSPAFFDLRLAGASADLSHTVLSTCAALTANATEAPLGESCEADQQNLYELSPGQGPRLINLRPGDAQGTTGAALGAQAGAISADGSRVYWQDNAGALYLREANQTKPIDSAAQFQAATPSGEKAIYLKAGHLRLYDAPTQLSTDLTPEGGVVGVLGFADNGSYAYLQDATGLRAWHAGALTTIAPGQVATQGDYPPATSTTRVSADGTRLIFLSKQSLSGYDNTDQATGQPDTELFLYDAGAPSLACISCNPTNQRPIGPSTIPGALANGSAAGSVRVYKPRVLSADARRVFFDSGDAISATDTNSGATDAYQWEAAGEGSCTRPQGCLSLIGSGRSPGGSRFIDASADGSDAYFITDDSLLGADPGALDLYDARVGGGFGEPAPPIPCEGDACQFLPSAPTDPPLTTLLSGPGNAAVRFVDRKHCKLGFVRRGGRCVEKHHKKHHHHKKKQKPKRGGGR